MLTTNVHGKEPINITKNLSGARVYISLLLRSLLFIVFGLIFVAVFYYSGSNRPLVEAQKWWPYQVIFANFSTFFLIRGFLKTEGVNYIDMFKANKIRFIPIVKEFIFLLLVAIIGGALPLYIFAYLLLGTMIPPDIQFQPLPVPFAVTALVLFPISNALVETPTYLGYALPRIKNILNNKLFAILLVGFSLAAQHMFLPLVLDPTYMLWRLLSFLPLSIMLGFIFLRSQRLLPIVVVHLFMDLQLVIQMLINSIT